MKRLLIATANKAKAGELVDMIGMPGMEIKTLTDFPSVGMPPETGETFTENALIKARHAAAKTGMPSIADDSGLEVAALSGMPGVFSARYAGVNATDEENFLKLLEALKGVPMDKRQARFVCVIAFCAPAGPKAVFEGELKGMIAFGPKGKNGFGYDPVFFLPGQGKTVAELKPEEKNLISHRRMAIEKMRRWFAGHN
ncbi:MAG: XTP/dITP diphosphatase [Deltaproteobacteria bacterium]